MLDDELRLCHLDTFDQLLVFLSQNFQLQILFFEPSPQYLNFIFIVFHFIIQPERLISEKRHLFFHRNHSFIRVHQPLLFVRTVLDLLELMLDFFDMVLPCEQELNLVLIHQGLNLRVEVINCFMELVESFTYLLCRIDLIGSGRIGDVFFKVGRLARKDLRWVG
jgi:hypothetical protein